MAGGLLFLGRSLSGACRRTKERASLLLSSEALWKGWILLLLFLHADEDSRADGDENEHD